ncbi:SDR family oxidoreductase [Candidatus Aenigmatarchaeota archaeon]
MTTVLVTGGAGFIGSNIVEDLISQGYNVKILDDFSTGNDQNISKFIDKIELVKGSITDMEVVKKAVKDVDYISHQAALPSVTRSVEEPVPSAEVNIIGTLNLLVAARDSGVKRIVYASSSSIYAGVEGLPKKESMETIAISPYGLTKIANEQYFRMFHDIYGFESVGLRYFNVFGPRQNPKSEYAAAIPKFISMILDDKSPPVYGDGKQTRDFTFVKDAAMSNIISFKVKNANGSAFNIATGKQTSVNDLITKINEILGKQIKTVHEDPRPGDPKHSLADISQASKFLGYKPKHDLESGLKITIDWFKERK